MPDIDRIQDDLIGRRISEQPNGYHHKNWYWEIESGEIRDLEIRNKIQTQNECLYELRFIVQDVAKQGSSHEMFVNITYILRDNKYWDVEFVESKQVNIVKTGKYNNCITSQRKGHNGEYYVEFVNYSDIDLVVGGAVSYQYSNETRHFNSIVKANSTSSVGGIFLGSIEDYTIHFIERP